jgi:predicted HAD superfamily phosphohydrolase
MITATQKAKINKMNRASQDVSLGTLVQGFQGSVNTVLSSAQPSASSAAIATGLSAASGYVFQQFRSSGSLVVATSGSQYYVKHASGTVTISSPAANVIQTGDIINLVTFQ